MEQAFRHIPGLARPVPDIARLRKLTPELKSIVTHPPKLNARPTRGPAPGAL
jgi:amidase